MQKRVFLLTITLILFSGIFLGYQIFCYYTKYPINKIEKEIQKIEEETTKNKEDINKLNMEKDKLINDNKEKVVELELWEKAVQENN